MKICPKCNTTFDDNFSLCPYDQRVLEQEPFIGKLFQDKYLVESRIGKGGMGVVYRAQDPGNGQYRAIKMLAPEMSTNQEVHDRFLLECQMLEKLQHTHIVKLYESGKTDYGMLFMVMEFIEGKSLKSVIDERVAAGNSFSPIETLDMLEPIAEALSFAHDNGIIHRDLKPDNIMVSKIDNEKSKTTLLDLGIAKMRNNSGETVAHLTVPGQIVGTAFYMSPEQWESKKIDNRIDIYAFGAVIHEMIAGKKAFPGPKIPDLIRQHMIMPRPRLEGVPEAFAELLLRSIAKEKEERPTSIINFVKDLRLMLEQVEREPENVQSTIEASKEAATSTPQAELQNDDSSNEEQNQNKPGFLSSLKRLFGR
ncbi:MAG: serine/threonine protein kinase [Blastocatellia bacterium]|nr:serine/threonine protein kinase [Blastocatellia bacterium]